MSTALVRFYRGEAPDHRARFLHDIQAWDHETLEDVHDYIQWLFPLPEPSPVNPRAPVLDRNTIQAFAADEDLRAALLRSLRMMIEFYGYRLNDGLPPSVIEAPDFSQQAGNWLNSGNHNHLRITRILRSTRLLGLQSQSQAFFAALRSLYGTERGRRNITATTFRYWSEASGQ